MKLEDIGFYTLSDERAKNVSLSSPMKRCEMILTDKCNFKCPYCRGLRPDARGDIRLGEAIDTLESWAFDELENVRFSGGEPTLYRYLDTLVAASRDMGVKRVAISTNGSAHLDQYMRLLEVGVNDFSISLDACCASFASKMAGRTVEFDRLANNIHELSMRTYVTAGVVLNEENVAQLADIVMFAHELGVDDIRIIPAAQYAKQLASVDISQSVLDQHPILKYRINRAKQGKDVRGIKEADSHKCALVLDDSVVARDQHFPCIIHLREGGNPIGRVGPRMRLERAKWHMSHNTYEDPICRKNCLDVCVQHNRVACGMEME